jgi:hypothetical protein
LVEQRIENPRVGGSNPPSGTIPRPSRETSKNPPNGQTSFDRFVAAQHALSPAKGNSFEASGILYAAAQHYVPEPEVSWNIHVVMAP